MRECRFGPVRAAADRDRRPIAGLPRAFGVMRAQTEHDVVQLSGMARCRRRDARHWCGQHGAAPFRMPGKAARGEHNALAGDHLTNLPALLQPEAIGTAPERGEMGGFRLSGNRDTALARLVEKASDEGIAHQQARVAAMRPFAPVIARDNPQRIGQRPQTFLHPQEMRNVITVDLHPAQNGEFRDRWAHQLEVFAQKRTVKGLWLQRAAKGRRALQLIEVVGVEGPTAKPHAGLILQPVDHLRAAPHKGFAQPAGGAAAHRPVEKAQHLIRTVLCPQLITKAGIGHPGRARRKCRGTPEIFCPLDQQHPRALQRGKNRRREARCPRPQHNHIIGFARGEPCSTARFL